MSDRGIKGYAYQERRRQILRNATACGICQQAECPWCHGRKAHCAKSWHIHHVDPRVNGGAVAATNEVAAHACCNLKQGSKTAPIPILRTSRNW